VEVVGKHSMDQVAVLVALENLQVLLQVVTQQVH
jgi:hypothetical protein